MKMYMKPELETGWAFRISVGRALGVLVACAGVSMAETIRLE